MKKHPYDEAADRLLSEFPDIRILGREKRRGGHKALTLEFEGRRRSVFYPGSSGDNIRGPRQHCGDIRRVLRELGVATERRPA